MYVRPRHAGAHGYRRKVAKYTELIKDEEAKLGGVLRGGSDYGGGTGNGARSKRRSALRQELGIWERHIAYRRVVQTTMAREAIRHHQNKTVRQYRVHQTKRTT